jgi:hypothetical protein
VAIDLAAVVNCPAAFSPRSDADPALPPLASFRPINRA